MDARTSRREIGAQNLAGPRNEEAGHETDAGDAEEVEDGGLAKGGQKETPPHGANGVHDHGEQDDEDEGHRAGVGHRPKERRRVDSPHGEPQQKSGEQDSRTNAESVLHRRGAIGSLGGIEVVSSRGGKRNIPGPQRRILA
jgi:hypothetical protein